MAALYKINQEILSVIDLETGEVLDEERLAALQIERDEKIENIAKYIINLTSDAEQYKERKKYFEEMEKAATKKAAGLKAYLEGELGGAKFKTADVNVSYTTSTAVEVESDAALIEWAKEHKPNLLNRKETVTLYLTEIKNAINAGEEIPGAKIVKKKSMQVK